MLYNDWHYSPSSLSSCYRPLAIKYSSEFHWRNALYLPTPYDFTNPYNYADFRRNELLKINLTEFRFPYQYLNDIEWADSPTPLLCNSMTSNGKGGLSHQCGLSMNEG